MQVHIGKPFQLPDLGHRPKPRELEAFTELIMVHIARLLPERYHGYYAESLALAALRAGQDPWVPISRAAGLKESADQD
jgi:1-acyl-sn-glycerol-3-phosphate acyltransferase